MSLRVTASLLAIVLSNGSNVAIAAIAEKTTQMRIEHKTLEVMENQTQIEMLESIYDQKILETQSLLIIQDTLNLFKVTREASVSNNSNLKTLAYAELIKYRSLLIIAIAKYHQHRLNASVVNNKCIEVNEKERAPVCDFLKSNPSIRIVYLHNLLEQTLNVLDKHIKLFEYSE